MINETTFHADQGAFRAVTGGAYNIPNSYGEIVRGTTFPIKGTVPLAVTYPGTIKTTGKAVRGTGTDFSILIVGSYVYAGDVLRQIDYVVSPTFMFLKEGFPADLSSDTALRICERQFFKMIIAESTHASASAILQEAPFSPGSRVVSGGAPYSYDATSGTIAFQADQ